MSLVAGKIMTKISQHFTSPMETACRCGCGQDIIKPELVSVLEAIRNIAGLPIIIHCWNRCPAHNERVGGVLDSQHVFGNAADFHIKNMLIKDTHKFISNLYDDKIIPHVGYYDWGCHVDIRDGQGNWGEKIS